MIAAFDQNNPFFWIVTGVGTVAGGAALVAIGRWLWMTVAQGLREWLQAPALAKENAAEARQSAEVAAEHAVEIKQAIGETNGRGDLVTMVTQSLSNQEQMFAWQIAHDKKDDQTRADVAQIKQQLAGG